MSFDWMTARAKRDPGQAATRRSAMYRTEIAERAALLRRLGFSEAATTARVTANLAFDFDVSPARRPADLGDAAIAKLVAEAYQR